MLGGQEDMWDAFVDSVLSIGPAAERRSRYGAKRALWIASREIAHQEAAGVIDLRITRTGWSQVKERYATDPVVRRDPSRRDWIELHLRSAVDLEHVTELLAVALAANA
jgi:hypothetical protein